MKAKIVAIGIVDGGDGREFRFVRELGDWRLDLLVNHETKEVANPPDCFEPDVETLKSLDAAWETFRKEAR
jgi:hypothetical protein